MAYDYGNTAAKQKRSPAQGKHAKRGPRAQATSKGPGKHTRAETGAPGEKRTVAPAHFASTPKPPVVKAATAVKERHLKTERRLNYPRADQRRSSPLLKKTSSSPQLLAEYFAGFALIAITLFTRGGKQGYQSIMGDLMIRLSALTAIFFVLFLMSGGPRSGTAAAWFGLLIDLGIVYAAAQNQDIARFASMITGQGVDGGSPQASDISSTPTEFHDIQGTQLELTNK